MQYKSFIKLVEAPQSDGERMHDSLLTNNTRQRKPLKTVVQDRDEKDEAPTEKDREFDKLNSNLPLRVRVGSTLEGPFRREKEERQRFPYKRGRRGTINLNPETAARLMDQVADTETGGGGEGQSESYSSYNDNCMPALYELKDEGPKCPIGYKWNPKTMRCEPKTAKDSVAGSRGEQPYPQNNYNVIGSSGYDGGWAFQEPPTNNRLGN